MCNIHVVRFVLKCIYLIFLAWVLWRESTQHNIVPHISPITKLRPPVVKNCKEHDYAQEGQSRSFLFYFDVPWKVLHSPLWKSSFYRREIITSGGHCPVGSLIIVSFYLLSTHLLLEMGRENVGLFDNDFDTRSSFQKLTFKLLPHYRLRLKAVFIIIFCIFQE